VVHAVLAKESPGLTVIDLTHQVPAFDVRAGAGVLARAAPYLGPGVVLAVVDPGVGSDRRGLCVPVTPAGAGPSYFVGPDNGLLIAAAELTGGAPLVSAFALRTRSAPAGLGHTFDGRDLFAPVAAALCRGVPPEELGDPVDPASLVRLPPGVVRYGRLKERQRYLRAEISWVDHFGNLQLAATSGDAAAAGVPRSGSLGITHPEHKTVRRVETFADLTDGELGLLVDANGHLAVVAAAASAAALLGWAQGEQVLLTW